MEFFDQKEEVIDIQLTQFGKHLLSKGRFKPEFYAFFDDDVLYDQRYAGNNKEPQNYSEPRIQENTPRLKTQYVYHGLETEVLKNNDLVVTNQEILGSDALQPKMEKQYVLSAPLGNSDPNSEHAPAWLIKFLAGGLASAKTHITGSAPTTKIPQLETTIEYEVGFSEFVKYAFENKNKSTEDATMEDESPDIPGLEGEIAFSIEGESLVLEINEKNTIFSNDNFDLEVYKIVEYQNQENNIVTHEVPLLFKDKAPNLADYTIPEEELNKQFEVNPNYVEYFFNIYVDNEIDNGTLCELREEYNVDQGTFSWLDKVLGCPTSEHERIKPQYGADEDSGEIC